MVNPRVFIIILHYSSIKDTEECLKSLKGLDYDNFKIIIVDNGTNHKIKPGDNVLIRSKENIGFAAGNNIGIKYALDNKADYVLLLNNDTVVHPNFLKELIGAGENNDKIGILGPKIYYHNSNKTWFAGGKVNFFYTKGIHVFGKTDYITGCCMLIKKQVINKIGLMHEPYFLYFEDADYCLNARRKGFKCMIVHSSKIWHKVSQSIKKDSFEYIYYNTRNGLLLCMRNAFFLLKIFVFLDYCFLMYIKQLIKLIIFPKNEWSKPIMLGIKDFYKSKFGKH